MLETSSSEWHLWSLYESTSHYYILLSRKLLKRQISQRLGSGPADADPIKTHPFFKHISWADVISRKLDPPFKPVLASDVNKALNLRPESQILRFRTMWASLTPTSPARPRWIHRAAPRSRRVSTWCSKASPMSPPQSSRRCKRASSDQGASGVPDWAHLTGDKSISISRLDHPHFRGGFSGPSSVTLAGAGPSGVAAGASGFTTIYPVTECMEVGEGKP